MKTFSAYFLSALMMLCCVANLRAEDPPAKHTYEGEVTGVVCAACKMHISQALMEKLHGTVNVDVLRGDKLGVNKIVIVSTDPTVTVETARTALGDLVSEYTIVNLAEKK
jgi:hypothetical protein